MTNSWQDDLLVLTPLILINNGEAYALSVQKYVSMHYFYIKSQGTHENIIENTLLDAGQAVIF